MNSCVSSGCQTWRSPFPRGGSCACSPHCCYCRCDLAGVPTGISREVLIGCILIKSFSTLCLGIPCVCVCVVYVSAHVRIVCEYVCACVSCVRVCLVCVCEYVRVIECVSECVCMCVSECMCVCASVCTSVCTSRS